MSIDTSEFITGDPIELPYATFRFLTFREYIRLQKSLSIMSLSTLNIYYNYKKILDNPTEEDLVFLKELKDTPLREIILRDELFLYHYLNIIEKVVDCKEGYDIQYLFDNDEQFMEMRKYIIDMNLAKEEKAFYNEELQEGIERSKKMNQGNMESQTAEDVITCIVSSTSNSFDDVLGMSIYQAYAIYARISSIMNYKTAVTFKTIDPKYDIEHWNKHINLLGQEKTKDKKREEVINQKF